MLVSNSTNTQVFHVRHTNKPENEAKDKFTDS